MRMHPGQVDLTTDVVATLVASQFPQWRGQPVRVLASTGTVNALFRMGDDVILRFPLQPGAGPDQRATQVAEQDAARRIAPHVPLPVPEPLALGEPADGYPGYWTVYRWIPGDAATGDNIENPDELARDLAAFVAALHAIDTEGRTWDGISRGGPLHGRNADVRRSLTLSTHLVDTLALRRIWEHCLAVGPTPGGHDVWLHADLMPGNLIIGDGRLSAVIDLGMVCIGDPAVDLMPAWNLLPPQARDTYRRDLGVDEATWARGMGWALVQAIVALPYYVDTNPAMANTARHTLAALIASHG